MVGVLGDKSWIIMFGLCVVNDLEFIVWFKVLIIDFMLCFGYSLFYLLLDFVFWDMVVFGCNLIGNGLYKFVDGLVGLVWEYNVRIDLVFNFDYYGNCKFCNKGL